MEDIEITEQGKIVLEQRRAELVKIIESFDKLERSEEWITVKTLVFGQSLQSIERQLLSKSLEQNLDMTELYRLQGKREWAKRYEDVPKFISSLKKELEDIKRKLI